jgi:uncharacterized protein YjbJ (UPF0337 family)
MNWDQVQSQWMRVSGKTRERWGKLTDDGQSIIAVKGDQLAGLLQQHYGNARDKAEKLLEKHERQSLPEVFPRYAETDQWASRSSCNSRTGWNPQFLQKVLKMKKLFRRLAIVTLAVISGCSQGKPGGPGTTDTSTAKPMYGQTENTFNLSVPILSTSVQQGEQADVSVGIKRAKNFDEDVTLTFTDVPQGVTIDPASPEIKHGDTDAKFAVKATEEAALGEFKIKVTGHPSKGGDAEVEFKLTVAAMDSFTLSPPRFSTSLKQGESKTVTIGIRRAKKFDQDVALNFGEMPTGVTHEPASPVIKNGESDTQITFTGADDAALGNFDIKMTGHPTEGKDASKDFKLSVVKP